MRGQIAALVVATLAAAAMAGCAQAPAQNAYSGSSAPFNYQTNPTCGVYSNCQPAYTQSYGIQSNHP